MQANTEYISRKHEIKDRQKVCEWRLEDDDYAVWDSDCGMEFLFNDDGPVENNFAFCPGCGNRLVVSQREEK